MAKRGLWEMLAVAATFGLALALAGCGGNGNGGGGGGAVLGGDTLTLTGSVYTMNWNTGRVVRFRGDREIDSLPQAGTGAIANGRLSFEIGRINAENLWRLDDSETLDGANPTPSGAFDGATVAPSGALGAWLELATPDGGWLWRVNDSHRISGNTVHLTGDIVEFIFVDRDVTVSRGEVTYVRDEFDFTDTTTTEAFSITLQQGWNAVQSRIRRTVNMLTDTSFTTVTISTGNPNARWRLDEHDWDNFSEGFEPLGETPARQGRGWLPSPRARR